MIVSIVPSDTPETCKYRKKKEKKENSEKARTVSSFFSRHRRMGMLQKNVRV